MRCGDRLGHALALGVDVEEWYDSKANRILISQMDYLDNLVWLYSKIRKHHIEGCEYAYLALALEKMKDEDKNPRFSRTLIYQWLDNVRRMGLVQSFEEVENG